MNRLYMNMKEPLKPPLYRAGINVLHIENEEHVPSDFRDILLQRNIFVHRVDNLEGAKSIAKRFDVDLIVSDGMFPKKAGEPEVKSFIPFVTFLRKNNLEVPIIAWSNSTHVHEFCKKEGLPYYSKFLLTRERFKMKGREYIEVPVKTPQEMADIVIEKLRQLFGLSDVLKESRFKLYYAEPATVLGFFMALDMRTTMFQETAGLNYGPMIVEITDRLFSFYMDQSNDKKIADSIYHKILHQKFFPTIKKEIDRRAKRLLVFSRPLKELRFSDLSNAELRKMYLRFLRLFMEMRMYSSLPMAMEHMSNTWTELLAGVLSKRISDAEERNGALATLTSPERVSYINEYEVGVAVLGLQSSKGEDISKGMQKLLLRFAWVEYTFEGTPITEKDVRAKMASLGKSTKDFQAFLEGQKTRLLNIRADKERLRRKYALSKEEAQWFEIGADIVFIKYFRKGVFAESYYNVEFLLAEIGKRIGLSGRQVGNMLGSEVLAALELGSFPPLLIDKRMERSSMLCHNSRSFPLDPESSAVWSKAIIIEAETTEIKGQVAFAGTAKGVVRIVNTPADMHKMQEGDVLVSRSTNPSLVTAMRKAAAFITDVGGLTCHAAIVAREMQKPCIVGTKTATQTLKDGDMVEVDAKKGVVRKI